METTRRTTKLNPTRFPFIAVEIAVISMRLLFHKTQELTMNSDQLAGNNCFSLVVTLEMTEEQAAIYGIITRPIGKC